MWDKKKLKDTITQLESFADECYCLDKEEEYGKITDCINVLQKQLDMLNEFEPSN